MRIGFHAPRQKPKLGGMYRRLVSVHGAVSDCWRLAAISSYFHIFGASWHAPCKALGMRLRMVRQLRQPGRAVMFTTIRSTVARAVLGTVGTALCAGVCLVAATAPAHSAEIGGAVGRHRPVDDRQLRRSRRRRRQGPGRAGPPDEQCGASGLHVGRRRPARADRGSTLRPRGTECRQAGRRLRPWWHRRS